MKRGSFSLPHVTIYSIILVLVCGLILMSLQARQGKSFFEIAQQQETLNDYYFGRSLVDVCFSTYDDRSRMLHGHFNLSSFTDIHLRTCTTRPLRITLDTIDESGVRITTTQDSLREKPLSQLFYQEYVLVEGKRALFRVEVPRA
ncbi:hypothetical protein J4208_02645 [Candidatus Woesearchaeota archaeon]|nr:hypothetical protein [Candidatus Woesearchaeota archaeon]